MHQTSKHVTVQSRYVMECVQLGSVVLLYIPSREQRADIFTKALSGTLFRYHRDSIMGQIASQLECALMTLRVADVPKSMRVMKLILRFRQFHQLLVATQWSVLVVGLVSSMAHKRSMYQESLTRYDRLLKALTRRIIAKGKGWVTVSTARSPDASSGSVRPARQSTEFSGQSCEQCEAPKILMIDESESNLMASPAPLHTRAGMKTQDADWSSKPRAGSTKATEWQLGAAGGADSEDNAAAGLQRELTDTDGAADQTTRRESSSESSTGFGN